MPDPNIGPNPPWVVSTEPKSTKFDNGCVITWDEKNVIVTAVNGNVTKVDQLTGEV